MQNQLCTIHQKELEIICLTDFTKVCALCAVFGGAHKDHKLKTVDEMTKMLGSTVDEFEQLKQKKKTIESKIKNPEFKSQIVQKMSTTKLHLSTSIKDQFTEIRQAVDQAQKNANDDLNKRFKQVHDKINKLAKQQSQFEGMFSNWSRMIQLQMAEMNRVDLLYEQKVQIYWESIMTSMKQGAVYLSQIQLYTEDKRKRMEAVPQMVAIKLGENLIKDIYNHVSIKFDESSLDKGFSEVMLMDLNKSDDEVLLRLEMEGRVNRSLTNQGFDNSQRRKLGSPIKSKPISNPVILQPTADALNNYQRKPITVQFSSSHNFLSPNKEKILSPPLVVSQLRSLKNLRKSPSQKPKSLPKHPTPKRGQNTNINKKMMSPGKKNLLSSVCSFYSVSEKRKIQTTIQGVVDSFLQDDKLDTLDLSSFEMPDNQIIATISVVITQKKIKCLKLSQNKLTNEGFGQIISLLRFATNLNLSHNLLTEQVLSTLVKQRQKVPNLRILNLAHNKLNQRKGKVYVQQLKKQGIIVKL